MVRIKHRYLLINVLYPDEELKSSALNNKSSKNSSTTLQPKNKTFNKSGDSETQHTLPWTVQFRRPSADSFNAKLLAKLIRDGVAELFGDYGAGMIAASFQVKYISPTTSTAIIRVSRSHYRLIWAALSFITKIPLPSPSFNNHNHHNNNKNSNNEQPRDRPCVVQVVRVSGTIKKAEEEAIRRARIVIARARRVEKRRRGGAAVGEGGFMEEDGEVGGIEDLGMDLDEDEDEDDESGE